MADITHGTWIKDGKAVDKVFSNGKQVYGRNLLQGTNQGLTNWTFGANGSGGQYTKYAFDLPTGQGMTMRTTVAYANWFWLGYNLDYTALKQNTDYVVSFWAKSTDINRTISARFANGGGSNTAAYFGTVSLKAGVKTKVVLRTTTNDVKFTDQYLYLGQFNLVGGIDIWDLKLEAGTLATDYSPAPEDILN